MRIVGVPFAALLVLGLTACPPPQAPPPNPGPSPTPNPTPTPVGTPGAPGDACDTAADCDSGVCEGMGCGPNQGVCAAKGRACTRDLVTYCGCDGQTFQNSGSCPGNRYSKRGPCDDGGQARTDLADGEKCSAASECASGVCEGLGCGDLAGTCQSENRACTMDIRQYCGCDGTTFNASGSCPGRLYAKAGACDG